MSRPTQFLLLQRSRWSAWMGFAAWAIGGPALCQQDMVDRVRLDGLTLTHLSVSQMQGEPLATAGPTSALGVWAGRSTIAQQTMLWVEPPQGRLSLGVGVEQRASRSLAPAVAGVLVGVALTTSQRSQLTLQTALLNASRPSSDELWMPPGSETREVRMGLLFHTSNRYAQLRRGVRVELSGQTTLSFRPRGGRIGVTLQSRW